MIEQGGMDVAISPSPMVNHTLENGKAPSLMALVCTQHALEWLIPQWSVVILL